MWQVPPMVGTRVILNPGAPNYESRAGEVGSDAGTVISTQARGKLVKWVTLNEHEREQSAIEVRWDNGLEQMYRIRYLLPVESYKDSKRVELSDGTRITGMIDDPEIEQTIDKYVISKGKIILEQVVYDETYRAHLLDDCINYLTRKEELNEEQVQILTYMQTLRSKMDAPKKEVDFYLDSELPF